jgi:hypothetical protein
MFCTDLRTNTNFCLIKHLETGFYKRSGVFTARYALSPYIKQIRFVFKGLIWLIIWRSEHGNGPDDSKWPDGAEVVYHLRNLL